MGMMANTRGVIGEGLAMVYGGALLGVAVGTTAKALPQNFMSPTSIGDWAIMGALTLCAKELLTFRRTSPSRQDRPRRRPKNDLDRR